MDITRAYLTPNEWSRPGRRLAEVLAVVMHWTANPYATAMNNRDYFESRKTGMGGYGSAHYVIGTGGAIVQCVPEDEVAYHVGSGQKDPASGQVYTDEARRRFGHYAAHPRTESPNMCTLGVELCPTDWEGHFTDKTIAAATWLCADILRRHGLGADGITTHHDVVGWKDCPRLWVAQPALLDAFRAGVADAMARGRA